MKVAGKVSVFLAGCAALWLLAAVSCAGPVDAAGGAVSGSGGSAGTGGVTFPLMVNGGGQRTVVPGGAELQGVTIKVTFTSPGKAAVYREFPVSGGEVTLDNGAWNAEVKAYNSEPRLRGIANTGFRVNGSAKVDIRISSAVGVKTEAELAEALDGSGQYYDSNPANENLILLEDDIDLTSRYGMITLAPGSFVIAAEPGTSRTIRRNWGAFGIGLAPGFPASRLILGKEGTGTLIFDGLGVDSGTGSALFYADGGRMFIKDGVEIKDVVYNGNRGAAIWVQNGGSLDMQGGKISGCEADYGAAISVEGAGSAFTMSGGEISDNTASTGYGGAVNVEYGSAFTMSGGKISGNTASANGGGVHVESGSVYGSGTFTKQSDGIIYGSDAESGLRNTADTGQAAYVNVESSSAKKRDSTAGVGVTLDSAVSGSAGGWE